MPQVTTSPVAPVVPVPVRSAPLPGWLRVIASTDDGLVPLVLRIALAVVMFPHATGKVFGWFGGNGFEGTMGYFTETVGIPWALGLVVIAAEFLGAVGLLVGLMGRVAAAGIAANMVGAILTVHADNGFFMDWNGTMAGEGFEFHLLVIAMALGIMIQGSGQGSIDLAMTAGRRR